MACRRRPVRGGDARVLAAGALWIAAMLTACGTESASTESRAPDEGGRDGYVSSGGDAMASEAVSEQTGSYSEAEPDGPSVELDVATRREGPGLAGAPPPSAPPPVPSELRQAKALTETADAPPASSGAARDTAAPDTHRLALVYEARIHLAVFETETAIDAAEELARDSGGYLVHRDDRSISFRVPSSKFHESLEAALALGDVLHREVSVKDVTDEFRDLRVRLRNAEAVRERLEQLLARADKVDQALQVERELERVAAEIERIKGRLAVLVELTMFSTITLQFQPPRPIDQVDSQVRLPFPWLSELGLPGLLRL